MPRKAFLEDLERLKASRIPNIVGLIQRKELGVLSIVYVSDHLPTGTITIQAEIPEVSDYPKDHCCFLYTDSDENPPPEVSTALGSLSPSLQGKPLLQIIADVTKTLERVLNQGSQDTSADLDEGYEEEGSEIEIADDDEIFMDDSHPATQVKISANSIDSKTPMNSVASERVRSDLRTAKRAGFKVGILGDLNAGGFVCISIRVTKLGISEEAMHAWGLRRKQYLILMIRFQEGYQTLAEVAEMSNLNGRTEMRVALCERYKPTIDDALKAFTQVSTSQEGAAAANLKATHRLDAQGNTTAGLEPLFIGRPLNDLLRERFPNIVKYRLACSYGWTGAENFFQETQGKSMHNVDTASKRYYVPDNMNQRTLPKIVTADAIADTITGSRLSLPLIAMQFLLRHVVRCTEFCLVCHCHVEDTFEALKPYVCSKPLCLYQYLALGFGPSVEWEIITQPYVVDLLVSFCYAQARGGRLRDFPTGIHLKIPLLPQLSNAVVQPGYGVWHGDHVKPKRSVPDLKYEKAFTARLDKLRSELLIPSGVAWPARNGDWLAVQSKLIQGTIHYRIQDASLYPNIKLDTSSVWISQKQGLDGLQTSHVQSEDVEASKGPPAPDKESTVDVDVFPYDKSLDELPADHQQNCVVMLLDTLPSILKLREHLLERAHGQDPSLRTRCPQLSTSALNLLRWIIASNRSCIMQVDKLADRYHVSNKSFSGAGVTEDRVGGMDGFMQFRFAQGAPDKEQRFIDCVKEVSARTKKPHPTIFAWHGSPLANWHSIVREGLHFKETLHGRSYGHGVYMARDASTSLSYAGMGSARASGWPNSDLKVQTTLSLNEVVNSPDEFVHKTPFYVVSQLDWIQTRYLFVKTALQTDSQTVAPSLSYVQDPAAVVVGEKSTAVTIPITAVSKSRRPVTSTIPQQSGGKKSRKFRLVGKQSIEKAGEDTDSVASDLSDREFLESDTEDDFMSVDDDLFPLSNGPIKRARDADLMDADAVPTKLVDKRAKARTDFVPGTLDVSELKILKEPRNATSHTTKALMKAFKEALMIQQRTPLHELGWYIHSSSVDNIYQWIVELHSFPPEIPLSRDMKKANLTSIVLEMRFTNSFPFSPPFVRVIQPRFLPFQAGGGGHVTAGGAICMELLTNNGWLLTNTMESVLLQIRMAMSSTDPQPARLQEASKKYGGGQSYQVGEAIEAYKRACMMHGWTVPEDFRDGSFLRE